MKKIPDDLKSLEERINKQRAVEKAARKDRPESEFSYATKTGFRVGTELVSGVLVGAALGYFLDKLFDTQPVLLIVCLFFCGAAGFLNVYRFVKNEDRSKEEVSRG